MKTAEFKNFMANVKELGIESSEIQSAGYAWFNLTDKQVETLRAYALEMGYKPQMDGTLVVGAYTFKCTPDEVAASMDAEIAESIVLSEEEFKGVKDSFKSSLEKAQTIEQCKMCLKVMHDLYEGSALVTPEMIKEFDLMAEERADVLLAHDTAVKMAKAQKGSGKHMSNKNEGNKPAEQTTEPVEVLKGEVIDTKTEKEVNAAIGRISAKVDKISKGYLDIVGDVARLRALKAWKVTGHKSMYDLCADKFGMSRATVGNLEAIFAKYGDKETYKLTDEAEGLSVRQMLANIKSEKTAELEDKGGESEDGESNGNGGKSGKGGKIETLTNISIQLGADWSIEEILEEIKAQLTEQNAVYPEGATLTLTITK